mmetsp:Transcript_60333/g.140992  ORF Transcript_60333/g.140992 Transcript_60333/m.140992 type:complete len:207 (-) Transcript_60333:242-862(-)
MFLPRAHMASPGEPPRIMQCSRSTHCSRDWRRPRKKSPALSSTQPSPRVRRRRDGRGLSREMSAQKAGGGLRLDWHQEEPDVIITSLRAPARLPLHQWSGKPRVTYQASGTSMGLRQTGHVGARPVLRLYSRYSAQQSVQNRWLAICGPLRACAGTSVCGFSAKHTTHCLARASIRWMLAAEPGCRGGGNWRAMAFCHSRASSSEP